MKHLNSVALARIAQCRQEILHSMKRVREGTPFAAEPDLDRVQARLRAMPGVSREALAAARFAGPLDETVTPDGRERIWGPTIDFVGVAFLERGWRAARSVARVTYRDGRPQGSGFLVAPGLFLTNHHVIESETHAGHFVVEFDYELDATGRQREITRFDLDPRTFFITDDTDDLDYTLIAVGPRLIGSGTLSSFGYCPLSGASDKHMLGECANVVQHPDGRFKEVVLRENRLVSRLDHVLHYVADTEPGSSGSPVFNNEWRAIALHHWGGPWRQQEDEHGRPLPREINEGIRISAIVGELQQRRGELNFTERRMLEDALGLGEQTGGTPATPNADDGIEGVPRVRIRDDGTVAVRVPVEISVGIPPFLASSAPTHRPAVTIEPSFDAEAFRRQIDEDYDNRRGYNERFVSGHEVPMPEVANALRERAARNRDAGPGESAIVFPYEHFSVVVDGVRRLPMVTACNIDGRNSKNVNRRTGRVTRAERIDDDDFAGPEAREKWFKDPRVDPDECANDELYLRQRLSGGRPARGGKMFHRGHMVRRLDPAWGGNRDALRAEADTFHFTNCTPQIGAFNSRRTLWQGIENHVLDNARSDDRRICVFTGPVLDDQNDPPYRDDLFPGFKVPVEFWKIVVWSEEGALSALAMAASQMVMLRDMPERAEDLADVGGVEDFVTTVKEIERVTRLKFNQAVHDADLFTFGPERIGEGQRRRRVTSFKEIKLAPAGPSGPSKKKTRTKKTKQQA